MSLRRHYLLQRKRGAGRGELAARRFAHHYVPLTALKSESRGSSDSLCGLPRAWAGAGGGRRAPRKSCGTRDFLLVLGPHPASTSWSHHCRVWHPSGAAFDHCPGLQECGHLRPLLKCVPFPGTWITPLACHQLVQKVNKALKALMPPCAPPLGSLVCSPRSGGPGWVHRDTGFL